MDCKIQYVILRHAVIIMSVKDGLQDELTPDVADKDVTVRKADMSRDTIHLHSS